MSEHLDKIGVEYQRRGFWLEKGLYSPGVLDAINTEVDRLKAAHPEVCTSEDESQGNQGEILHKISRFVEKSELMQSVASHSAMMDIVEHIAGESCWLCTDKINFKLPGARGFYPHQDMSGLWSDYVPNIISVFISLDHSTEENGCLQVSPGNHTKGMLGGKMAPLDEKHMDWLEWIDIPQEPGDTLFFDGYLPHRSAPNRSSSPRRVLLFTYTKSSDGNLRARILGLS